MVLADEAWAEKRGLVPVARLVSYGIAAVEPGMFGLGPGSGGQAGARPRRAGTRTTSNGSKSTRRSPRSPWRSSRELGLPKDIVNVEGGAVAHGHPIGATGAILTTKLIHSMRRDGIRRGIVTLCIGGGQGIALAIETIA